MSFKKSPNTFFVPITVLLLLFSSWYLVRNREKTSEGRVNPQTTESSTQRKTVAPLATIQQPRAGQTPTVIPHASQSISGNAIAAFETWAFSQAVTGFNNADLTIGLTLAKARAVEMKALIKADPITALRLALDANLRSALPKNIADAIEQPVNKTGLCSLRMTCNHAPDSPHNDCQSSPVLLEDIISWNAHYVEQHWQPFLGQNVGFEGIAVDEELAVRNLVPISSP
jgi:hypothetical protein